MLRSAELVLRRPLKNESSEEDRSKEAAGAGGGGFVGMLKESVKKEDWRTLIAICRHLKIRKK